jgi:hypothetical protein
VLLEDIYGLENFKKAYDIIKELTMAHDKVTI